MKSPAIPSSPASAELFASVAGLLVGTASLGIRKAPFQGSQFPSQPIIQILGLLGLAFLAASLFVVFLRQALTAKADFCLLSLRLGIRAGVHATLWGGALLACCATLDVWGAPSAAAEAMLRDRAWITTIVSIAAILPAVVCAFAGGVSAGRFIRQFRLTQSVTNDDYDLPSWWTLSMRSAHVLVVLGLASPCVLLWKTPVVDTPPPPIVVPHLAEPPPLFHYVKPQRFEEANPTEITIHTRKPFPAAFADKPMIITPDSRLAAFCPASGQRGSVRVMDLDTLDTVAVFVLPESPDHLAWSPDMTRLISICSRNPARPSVLQLTGSTLFQLPRPKNGDLPGGPCRWWSDDQVIFYPPDEPPVVLDLNTLLLQPLNESPKFRSADAGTHSVMLAPPSIRFPFSRSWRMELTPNIQVVVPPPRKSRLDDWTLHAVASLGFRNLRADGVQIIPSISLADGDRLIPSPDGSKLIHLSRAGNEIIYFGLRPPLAQTFRTVVPKVRTSLPQGDPAGSAASSQQLCAFAYAPLVNPLNRQTVGPDREQVRGLLRLFKWEGASVEMYAAESYQDIHDGDVMADLHTWEDEKLVPATTLTDSDWWRFLDIQPEPGPPESQGSVAVEKGVVIQSQAHLYTLESVGLTRAPPRPRREPPPTQPSSTPLSILGAAGEPGSPGNLASPAITPSPPSHFKITETSGATGPSGRTQEEVIEFIKAHHAKVGARDLDGLMTDYAESIKFPAGEGVITRERLRQKEAEDFARWPRGEETVESVTGVTKSGVVWTATYIVRFRDTRSDGVSRSGMIDLEMAMWDSSEGLKIQMQRASTRDVQTTNGSTQPFVPLPKEAPTVPTSVKKPYWTGTFRPADKPGLVMTDMLNLNNGVSTLHRTFQLLDATGRVEKQCRAEFTGTFGSTDHYLEVYPNQLRWGRDGDWDFVQAVKASAEGLVGGSFRFTVSGSDLVMPRPGASDIILHQVR